MSDPEALPAGHEDRELVVATVVAAFDRDPAFRYFFDDADFAAQAATFAGYLFDKRVSRNTVWMVGKAFAVSLWDGPDAEDPHAGRARQSRPGRAARLPGDHQPRQRTGVAGRRPVAASRGAAGAHVELYRRSGWEVASAVESGPVPIWVMRKSA